MAEYKKTGKAKKLIVAGCLVERFRHEIQKNITDVDHVIGWRHGPQKGETLIQHGAHAYVGDTIPDIEAARFASAHAIGVVTGPVSAGELRAAGAHTVMSTLLEFPAWLGGFIPG